MPYPPASYSVNVILESVPAFMMDPVRTYTEGEEELTDLTPAAMKTMTERRVNRRWLTFGAMAMIVDL
ncbi:hypothetical protein Hanom_Chr15g01357311 [Helianthus anomalus]